MTRCSLISLIFLLWQQLSNKNLRLPIQPWSGPYNCESTCTIMSRSGQSWVQPYKLWLHWYDHGSIGTIVNLSVQSLVRWYGHESVWSWVCLYCRSSICTVIHPSWVRLCGCESVHAVVSPSVRSWVRLYVRESVCTFVSPSVHLWARLYVCESFCTFASLSVCLRLRL